MPTYDYSCEKCGKTFEAFQSMRDEPFRECPKELCRQQKWGHGKMKRLLGTGAGLIFKGSGFYITDYRSNSYKEGAKKDAPAAPVATGEKSSGTKEGSTSTTASTPAKGVRGETEKADSQMTSKQMIKLVCPECQRQNEPERIYCHDCGARLDRSALAKVAPKMEAPEQTQSG